MIITSSTKPIRVIGFPDSTITQEGIHFLSTEYSGDLAIITPDEFLLLNHKDDYQYLIFFTKDFDKRIEIINLVEELKLDCLTYVHDSVVFYKDLKTLTCEEVKDFIGHGTVICPFSSVFLNAKIGKHCLIESYCLVSHYVEMSDNVIMHSGTMIAGRTKIGSHCEFNFKSSALNALSICEGVEVGALSNVTKDITIPGRYLGSTARFVGKRISFES
jgi:carbonic anhydrase/acetyltransferase-like protein (isoleucine patch superfamily)